MNQNEKKPQAIAEPQKVAVTNFDSIAMFGIDLAPAQLFTKLQEIGKAKAELPWHKMLTLGFLAGVYISMAGHLAIAVGKNLDSTITDSAGKTI